MDNSSGNANAVSSFNRKRPVRQKNKSRTDNKSAESCQRCGLQHSKGQCRAANSDCRTCGRKEDTSVKLYQVNGDPANVKGRFEVRVNTSILSIFVIQTKDSGFTPLLGRDWLDILFPGWRNRLVNPIENSAPVQKVTRPESDTGILGEIKENFPNIVNTDDKNPIREFEAHIHMKEGVTPIFFKSRNIPLSSKPKVVRALDRLCEDDVMESVRHSDWASPIVPVPKGEDEVRICADFKVTINKHIEKEHYPLPQIDELLAKVGSGKKFCIVDCMGAFQQILVNEASRKYLTVNTIKGLFRFKRLCFGVSVAPSIFQNIMDQILAGIEGVVCYLDDLLIYGDNDEHVKKILWEVLGRMNHYNVKINVAKCKFFVDTLKFLGHIISAEGIKPNPEKLTALMDAPQPKNLKQLQAFLGLVNYYGKFIRDLASELRPLYDLLKQENQDEVGQLLWREEHTRCFDRCKKLLSSEDILCHFDPNWEIVVAADASPDGLGAVMSHICPDGVERPVFFASRTLTDTERNYSQLDKEAAALIFALKKFYKFLYGHHFTLYTDHRPLISIFDLKKNNDMILSPRMQRWQVTMSIFDCELKYRPGKDQGNCDGLSRLPIDSPEPWLDEEINLKSLHSTDGPINYEIVRAATRSDRELMKLKELICDGWPENPQNLPDNMKEYWKFRSSLSVDDDCIYYGFRIVIPRKLQKKVLYILHETHTGIVKMKLMARSLIWWRGIDKKIENFVQECEGCMLTARNNPQKTIAWKPSTTPFERVHTDFLHFSGKTVILLVDSYSRWVEAKVMTNTSAGAVNDFLSEIFMRMGTPRELVSDNGPPFGSNEFIDFCKSKNIKVLKSPPYHPQSNGICERAVQTVKNSLKREMISGHFNPSQLQKKLNDYMTHHNHAPTTTAKMSPAEMVFNFAPNNPTNTLNPHFKSVPKLKDNLTKKKDNAKSDIPKAKFKVGDRILYRINGQDFVKWTPGQVIKVLSSVRYIVAVWNTHKQAHVDQLKFDKKGKPFHSYPVIFQGRDEEENDQTESDSESWESVESEEIEEIFVTPTIPRRSKRNRRPPRRLTYD
ncbi:Zinc finger, CCHC-type [Sergentomyia squamirostris]